MQGVIYKWTNNVTNKYYIGKSTSQKCRYDWFLNFEEHYAGPHIDKARLKYNDKSFWNYEILYSADMNNKKELNDLLNEKEKYYIKLYDANNKEIGYNISSGGTFGDTFYSLSQEERKTRIDKQIQSHKHKQYKWMYLDDKSLKVSKDEYESYLNDGWLFGRDKKLKTQISNSVKTSEKCKEANIKRRLTEEEKELLKLKKKEEKDKYKLTEEYKIKQEENKQKRITNIIDYNKSERHKITTINTNKNRWKNGCPNETKEKMRQSALNRFKNKKVIWIHNNIHSKMIDISELDKYIELGYERGRT